tara:strand:- start:1651 stop:2790 length:1140 start_codon:yes stop_codon:yes gene_type:complete
MKSNDHKADNKGILIVYNTCTLNLPDYPSVQLGRWMGDVKKILSQDIFSSTEKKLKCKIVVCECRGVDERAWSSNPVFIEWLDELKDKGVGYNLIKQYLPFGQAVNHTIKEIVKINGTYEYYMYWSSGLRIGDDVGQLHRIYELLKSNSNICRASLLGSDDNAPPENFEYTQEDPYVILPGLTVNDHCSIYSNEFFELFDRCIRPDLFVGNGSENAFSYMASSIGRQSVILPERISPKLSHTKRADGSNPGIGTRKPTWYINEIADEVSGCSYLNDSNELAIKRENCEKVSIIMQEKVPHMDQYGEGGELGRIAKILNLGRDDDVEVKNENSKFIIDTYGSDGMKLTKAKQKKLRKVLKSEFFLQGYDYNNIKSELLWR